jgi:hypothetical protein
VTIEIRSYRSVFDLERRIYRIDRVRLNPAGVPVRGAVYFVALLLLVLLAAALPLPGTLVRALPSYLRDLALPAAGAALLTVVRIDGRPAHLAARSLLEYAIAPSRVHGCGDPFPAAAMRWRPGEVLLLPDGSESRLRGMLCTGPAEVRMAVAHERVEWGRGSPRGLLRGELAMVRELRGRRPPRRAQAMTLRPGARLRVR